MPITINTVKESSLLARARGSPNVLRRQKGSARCCYKGYREYDRGQQCGKSGTNQLPVYLHKPSHHPERINITARDWIIMLRLPRLIATRQGRVASDMPPVGCPPHIWQSRGQRAQRLQKVPICVEVKTLCRSYVADGSNGPVELQHQEKQADS